MQHTLHNGAWRACIEQDIFAVISLFSCGISRAPARHRATAGSPEGLSAFADAAGWMPLRELTISESEGEAPATTRGWTAWPFDPEAISGGLEGWVDRWGMEVRGTGA